VPFLAGQVLTASQIEMETNNKPLAVVYHGTTQSLTNDTVTTLSANSERTDWSVTAMHDTTVNNSRITIRQDGLYLIIANVTFASNSTGRRVVEIWQNNAVQYFGAEAAPVTGGGTTVTAARWLDLTTGDYVQIKTYQNSGGALNVTLNEFSASYQRD
jgi:hypothetical protein